MGGSKDKFCAGAGLSPALVGIPNTCGGACSSIPIANFASFADCLICRVDEASVTALDTAFGVQPPDLPAVAANAGVSSCQKKLAKALRKAVTKTHKTLARCEFDNITAATPVDCSAQLSTALAKIQTKASDAVAKCSDSTGLLGCPFDMTPSPTCLGDAAGGIGAGLVDTTFGVGP